MNLTINISNGGMSIFSNKDIKQLKEINDRLDRLFRRQEQLIDLVSPRQYIHPKLERAIVEISRRAISIDKKVPDA